jgi:hypothetical protein
VAAAVVVVWEWVALAVLVVVRAALAAEAHQITPLVQQVKETKGGLEQPLKTLLVVVAGKVLLAATLLAPLPVMAAQA